MVLDRPSHKDDPFPQQPRKNVEAALAPVRLFDDDGDEAGNDVLMVHEKCGSLFAWRPTSGGTHAGSSSVSKRLNPRTSGGPVNNMDPRLRGDGSTRATPVESPSRSHLHA